MAERTSNFTPINVIIWSCVAVFIAVSAAIILNLFTDNIVKLNEAQEEKLFNMFLMEVAAIGVAAFGRSVGGKQANKASTSGGN
jgi:hypothetical protein